ncbi:MAG: phage portal protein [Clostridia bacterium]|nr:phage portal protein [Clostridia bacterium]
MGKFIDWFFGNNEIKNEVQTTEVDITQDTTISWSDDESSSGSITEKEAMQISAVASGVDLIASSIAYLPIKLYKTNEDGEKEEIIGDKRVQMLNVSNNFFDSAFNMKYGQVKSLVLYGTSYTYLRKTGRNNIEEMYYLNKTDVSPQLIKVGNSYDYKFSFSLFQDSLTVNSDAMMVASKDVARSTDIEGIGLLEKGKKVLRLALDEMNNSSNALGNKLPAYLSTPNSLSPQAKDNIRSSFKGLAKSNQVPIFEEGLTYNTVTLNPEELELLNSRKYSCEQIAQLLNIPFTYLVSSASSYATSSEESIRFLKTTLMPYITCLEQAYQRFLLTEKEIQQGYYFQFDTSQILKISAQELADYLKSLVNSGLMTYNEARKQLGLQRRENGDLTQLPVNCYFLTEDGEIILPSVNQGQEITEEQVKIKEDNNEEEQ